jgi:hypothetical protein
MRNRGLIFDAETQRGGGNAERTLIVIVFSALISASQRLRVEKTDPRI